MKKVSIVLLLVLLCSVVFANGCEFGLSVSPYRFSTGKSVRESYKSDYIFSVEGTADYFWNNGCIAGLRATYENGLYPTADFNSFSLNVFGGYVFYHTDSLSLNFNAGVGFDKSKTYKDANYESASFSVKLGLDAAYYAGNNWSITGRVSSSLLFGDDFKQGDLGVNIGILYSFIRL